MGWLLIQVLCIVYSLGVIKTVALYLLYFYTKPWIFRCSLLDCFKIAVPFDSTQSQKFIDLLNKICLKYLTKMDRSQVNGCSSNLEGNAHKKSKNFNVELINFLSKRLHKKYINNPFFNNLRDILMQHRYQLYGYNITFKMGLHVQSIIQPKEL